MLSCSRYVRSNTKQGSSPISSNKRILHFDIFRGFAILGIFMVNILVMNVSFIYRGDWMIENVSCISYRNNLAYSKELDESTYATKVTPGHDQELNLTTFRAIHEDKIFNIDPKIYYFCY